MPVNNNIVLLSDSYKVSHHCLYPPKMSHMYSYLESRGGDFRLNLFFGLQYYLKEYLVGKVVTKEKIDEAESFYAQHFGTKEVFNRYLWDYIVDRYDGHLPVNIWAIPEGTVIPTKNALVTIENTDPQCGWLTNWLETLLVEVWYPTTVATQSWYMKQIIQQYLDRTGTLGGIDFKLHDFGFRGVTCPEQAGIGGAAHLVNFSGTDTIQGIRLAQHYYNSGMCGFSIPASEHSTITSWGREGERKAFRNMLRQYPSGTIACVSDSYNIYDACDQLWGQDLILEVQKRDGMLVIRPDSGDPLQVLPKILSILGKRFGVNENDKGFKVLNPKIRVIQGDGVDRHSLTKVLAKLSDEGWSADNIAFGSGGGLLQKLDRDTCKFAFKASNATIDGEDVEVYKDPVTDSGKTSKRGKLCVQRVTFGSNMYTFRTKKEENPYGDCDNELEQVFYNGKLLVDHDFSVIRERAVRTGRAVSEFEGRI